MFLSADPVATAAKRRTDGHRDSQVKSLLMASGTSNDNLTDKVAGGTRLNCYQALKTLNESPPATPSALRIQ